MPLTLRVIIDRPRAPEFNMAADTYLLKSVDDPELVVLRLYEWEVPTVSLGFMQEPGATLDLAAMKRDGVAWVRRPTGGRAVLHWNDLTYSVVFSVNNRTMGSTIAETYKIIADCLMDGLHRSQIETTPHDSALDAALVRSEAKLPCFLAPNRDEIMAGNKKLIGSAQKRTARAVLQHGSIPFTADAYRLSDYSNISDERKQAEKRLFAGQCTSINAQNSRLTIEDLAHSLAAGFSSVLEVSATNEPWREVELAAITGNAQRAT